MFISYLIKYRQFLKPLQIPLLLSLSTALLVGCGGGGNNGGSDVAAPVVPDIPALPTPVPLIAPGAYVASLNGKDWVAMLLPTTQGSGNVTNFYGLHYNATDPDLYSGSGLIAGNNSATLTRAFVYPNISAATRTGSGTISNLGNGVVRASLSFPATGLEQGKDINVAASAPINYKYNTPANLSSVQGTWQGRWSYGVGYVDSFTLSITPQGAVSASLAFQQDCQITQGALSPNFDGTNLFSLSLTIPNATQCSLKNQTLNGAAFVTSSPVAGKSQRLILVGITTDGRGISFKADR
jgi:hypothetical protein